MCGKRISDIIYAAFFVFVAMFLAWAWVQLYQFLIKQGEL
jgi:hypothetical protein